MTAEDSRTIAKRLVEQFAELDPTNVAEHGRAFEVAWRAVDEAMSMHDAANAPLVWGELNLLAARLIEERPGVDPTRNWSDSLTYLDRCFTAFQLSGHAAGVVDSVHRIRRIIDEQPEPWPEVTARHYEFYLKAGQAAAGAALNPGERAAQDLAIARGWSRVHAESPDRRKSIAAHVESLARPVVEWAASAGRHRLAALASSLIGISLMQASDASQEPSSSDIAALLHAGEALEQSLVHARASGYLDLEASIAATRGNTFVDVSLALVEATLLAARGGRLVPLAQARQLLGVAHAALDTTPDAAAVERLGSLGRQLEDLEGGTASRVPSEPIESSPEAAADVSGQGLHESTQIVEPQRDALDTARGRERRREYLASFIEEVGDYSADRAHAIFERLLRGPEHEVAQMRAEGVPRSDPAHFEWATSQLHAMREHAKERISEDRKRNTNVAARTLLSQHLDRDARFALLLRAFSIDFHSGFAPDSMKAGLGLPDDPRLKVQVTFLDPSSNAHVLDTVCSALPPDVPLLTISNVRDLDPPGRPAKLFVSNTEWRTLVFCLIAEAAAIVLVAPPGKASSTAGLQEEIGALRALGRLADTHVVQVPRRIPDVLESILLGEPPLPSKDLGSNVGVGDNDDFQALYELGFEHVFSLDQIAAAESPFVTRIRSALHDAEPERHPPSASRSLTDK